MSTERFRIQQWVANVNGSEHEFFTPTDCDKEIAMAIAVALHGKDVIIIEDEGSIRVELTQAQLNYCLECGGKLAYGAACRCAEVTA